MRDPQEKLKKLIKRKREFSARGSNCPICKSDFRRGCDHSIIEAMFWFDNQIFKERMKIFGDK